MENTPSKILIIDTAWLGDVVFTTSLIAAVKHTWPRAEIHVLVAPRGEAVVRRHPLIDRVWVLDKRGKDRSPTSLLTWGRGLRAQSFSIVLNAHPSARSRLLTRLIEARVSVGYEGFGASKCFTNVIPNDLALEPDHVERRLNLIRELGIIAPAEPLMVGLDPEAIDWTDSLLAVNNPTASPLLALVCGSAWKTKRWNQVSFAELGRKWAEEEQGKVLVFAGAAEREMASEIVSRIGPGAIPVVDEPLTRVAALLVRSEVTVGNDTGISFLAIAAGCPKVIVLYGSTQVNYTFPPPHKAIKASVPCCLPRTGHGARKCKWGDEPWCMKQISVDRVWDHVK